MKRHTHTIKTICPGSIAQELGVEPGDTLISIDGQEIRDIFDYQYLTSEESFSMLIEKQSNERWELEIEKDVDEDLGLEFDTGLMDVYLSLIHI